MPKRKNVNYEMPIHEVRDDDVKTHGSGSGDTGSGDSGSSGGDGGGDCERSSQM